MTPQEQAMIEKLAEKLAAKTSVQVDPAAQQLIEQKLGSQSNILYRLAQLALAQEIALTELQQRNEYLQRNADFYQNQSQRGSMSRMFGRQPQPPVPPAPSYQPSAFSGFMQTAAGVAAGMVAGSALSHLFFSDAQAEPVVEEINNTFTSDPAQDDSNSQDAPGGDSFLAGTNDYTQDYTQDANGSGGWNTDTGFDPDGEDDLNRWSDNDDAAGFDEPSGYDDSDDFGSDDSSDW